MIRVTNKAIAVFGDTLENRLDPIVRLSQEHFIFSVWPFYNSPAKKRALRINGIHDYVSHEGPLMLDSGGFQMIRKKVRIAPRSTIDIYDRAKLRQDDLAIALDICPRPDDPAPLRIQKIQQTNANYREMVQQDAHVLHVVHGWTRKELELSMQAVDGMLSVGSYLAMLAKPANFTMIQMNLPLGQEFEASHGTLRNLVMSHLLTFMDLLQEKHFDEYRVHVLGASSSHSSHLLWYAGMDQMDSASWRLKAAFGKIMLPGVSEISISGRGSTFGKSTWGEIHDRLLSECNCPVCEGRSLADRKSVLGESFQDRALHNAFIYLGERDLARELLGTRKYLPYLQKRFSKTPFWAKFLKKVDEGRHQKQLEAFLKER